MADPATIDELLERACADGVVPGVVAMVADRDGVVYEGAAGRLRIGDDAPATADTMFRIASMTKALTSVAALQLIEQGRLALDQTVASVIPAFGELQLLEGFDGDEPRLRKLSREPTIQHLLTHTSGLAYWFSNPDLLPLARGHRTRPTRSPACASASTLRSSPSRASAGSTESTPPGSDWSSRPSPASRSTRTSPSTSSRRSA